MNMTKLAALVLSCFGLMLVVYGIIDLQQNGRVGLVGLILVIVGASLTRKLLSGRRE
jgi:hypothetical protein